MKTYIVMLINGAEFRLVNDFDEQEAYIYYCDEDFEFLIQRYCGRWEYRPRLYFKNLVMDFYNGQYSLTLGDEVLSRVADEYIYRKKGQLIFSLKTLDDIEKVNCNTEKLIKQKTETSSGNYIITSVNAHKNEYNEVITKYGGFYRNISYKDFFETALSNFLEWREDLGEEIVSFEEFFNAYIKWEECFKDIINSINLTALYRYFPESKKFLISVPEIEGVLNDVKKSLNEDNLYLWEEKFITADEWIRQKPDKQFELLAVLKNVYNQLCYKNDDFRITILREKYTMEAVLELYKNEAQDCLNKTEQKKFLGRLLERLFDSRIIDEKQLNKEIKKFFVDYKHHEQEYKKFVGCANGQNYCVFEYSEEKEARYQAGKDKDCEKEEALLFNKIFGVFKHDMYTAESTKLQANIQRLASKVQFCKEIVCRLLESEILFEQDGILFFKDLERLKTIKNKYLLYDDWLDGDGGQKFFLEQEKKNNEKYKPKRLFLQQKILSDSTFSQCTNKTSRLKYLRNLIETEYIEGRDNYFRCLDAYKHKQLGVCFQGEKAKDFIEETWHILKKHHSNE